MSRTTTQSAASNGQTTETLPELHARLIGEYGKTTGATKARISKNIGDSEYAMELQDIEYDAWVKPSAVNTKWLLTEDDLRARYVKASALANDPSKREMIRDRALKDVETLEAQANRRGIALPEPIAA